MDKNTGKPMQEPDLQAKDAGDQGDDYAQLELEERLPPFRGDPWDSTDPRVVGGIGSGIGFYFLWPVGVLCGPAC